MKREFVEEKIREYVDAGNVAYGFYASWKPFENAMANRWGKLCDFDDVMEDIEKSRMCVNGELPIERLVIYSDSQCMCFGKNERWDCVNDDSEDSHTITVVPYIASDGWFGYVVSERND